MHRLENYYSGDDRWSRYVALYNEGYIDDNPKILAYKLNGLMNLAVVIYGRKGFKEGIWWIEQQVPMLANIRPINCLNDTRLINRLRESLMKIP